MIYLYQQYLRRSVLVFMIIYAFSTCTEKPDMDHFTMTTVGLVQKRHYFIERLKGPARALFQVQKELNPTSKNVLQELANNNLFNHEKIKIIVSSMALTSNIGSIHKLWHDFIAYKCLDDDLFTREIIMLITLFYKHQVINFLPDHEAKRLTNFLSNSLYNNYEYEHDSSALLLTLESESVIDTHKKIVICQGLNCDDVRDHVDAMARLLHEESIDNIVINISMRFYHVNRLARAIDLLAQIKGDEKAHACFSVENIAAHFNHPFVKKIVIELEKHRNRSLFFKLWRRLESYDLINDREFIQESIMLVIMLYKNACDGLTPTLAKNILGETVVNRVTVQDMLTLYTALSALPIADMLNLLDEMVDAYEHASDQYELHNSTLNWNDWFRKYWWAPPVTALSLAFLFIKHSKALNAIATNFSFLENKNNKKA